MAPWQASRRPLLLLLTAVLLGGCIHPPPALHPTPSDPPPIGVETATLSPQAFTVVLPTGASSAAFRLHADAASWCLGTPPPCTEGLFLPYRIEGVGASTHSAVLLYPLDPEAAAPQTPRIYVGPRNGTLGLDFGACPVPRDYLVVVATDDDQAHLRFSFGLPGPGGRWGADPQSLLPLAVGGGAAIADFIDEHGARVEEHGVGVIDHPLGRVAGDVTVTASALLAGPALHLGAFGVFLGQAEVGEWNVTVALDGAPSRDQGVAVGQPTVMDFWGVASRSTAVRGRLDLRAPANATVILQSVTVPLDPASLGATFGTGMATGAWLERKFVTPQVGSCLPAPPSPS